MGIFRTLRLLLPQRVRRLPADLAAAIIVVALTNVAVFAPIIRKTPLRVGVGLVFVLFIPGYSLIAALFPEEGESPVAEGDAGELEERSRSGIDGIERVALSFGLSIAVVPLIGLILNFTPWGIRLAPIMVAVSGFTLASVAVADHRRRQLPEADRFRVPYRQWISATRTELFDPESRTDGLLNVLLVASILLATGSVAYAVFVPAQGEQFSELYILTEDEDGELVADGYPTEFVQGESKEVILGIGNQEQQQVEYTAVVVEQDVDIVDNETVVRDQRELQRFETTLDHNETWHQPHEIAPTIVGNDTRIMWLLYVDSEPPAEPSADNADYSVHLWADVSDR